MFGSKKPSTKKIIHKAPDNAFSVLNAELKRMHKLYDEAYNENNLHNMQIFYNQIESLQEHLKDALAKSTKKKKKEIKDIQNNVIDITTVRSNYENNNV